MHSTCGLIPVYNHPHTIATVVAKVLAFGLPVVLVDDGCDALCRSLLADLAAQEPRIHLVTLPKNRGKGAAVRAGLYAAHKLGFSHALQIDADGQHDPEDIPRLLAASADHPQAVVSGRPIYDQSVPKLRYYARYLTHVWIWINTLSLTIQDSMCGFRIYPVPAICQLLDSGNTGNRMDFDPEILVRWYWQGGQIVQLATQVRYLPDGISHFRQGTDNWLIAKLHTRLFFGMLLRVPRLLQLRPPGGGHHYER